MIADLRQQRAQVLKVEQQPAVVIGDLEHQSQHARLHVVESQDSRKQQRAEVADGRAQRMPLLAEDVPEHRGEAAERGHFRADLREALLEFRRHCTALRNAGEVTFDVGHEYRHADRRKAFRHHLQAHRLACACGPCNEAMAIRHAGQQDDVAVGVVGNEQR